MQYSDQINIGSGPHYAEGWLNIDVIPTDRGKQPDLLINILDLPDKFGKHAFKKAYVGHVLEHIDQHHDLPLTITALGHIAEKVMVVGPCLEKALASNQPTSLIEAIKAPENPTGHPWEHKWTPTEGLTAMEIWRAGFIPHIIPVAEVKPPEWPNPSTAGWQCAMWFVST